MRINRQEIEQTYRELRLEEFEIYFQNIEERINEVINVESYQGAAARRMKAYLKEVHGMAVRSFLIVLMEIETGMKGLLNGLGHLDSDERVILDQGYLEHIQDIVSRHRQSMGQMHDEFAQQVRRANNVMSLSNGTLERAMRESDHELNQAMRVTEESLAMMQGFNSNQLQAVQSLQDHLATLEQVLDQIDGVLIGGIENFRLGRFANSPLGRRLFDSMLSSAMSMAQNGAMNGAIEALSIIGGYISTLPPHLRRQLEAVKGRAIQCAFIGDPVNAATGNFIYDHVDIQIDGRYPLEFKRFYNSLDAMTTTLGRNWTHNYDIRIIGLEDYGLSVIYGDSRQEHYSKPVKGDVNAYISAPGNFNVLRKIREEGVIKGCELIFVDGSKYIFNKEGQLTHQLDPAGNEVKLLYDEERLIKVESPSGYLEFSYVGEYIEKVTDHTGRTTSYEYANDELTTYTDVRGHSYSYEYDARKRLVRITNPEGNLVVENVYDAKDRITKQSYADGSEMSYNYRDWKKETTFIKQNGSKFVYKRDDQYRTTGIIEPDGEIKIKYNENGQRSRYIDKLGNETLFEYDQDGNLSKVTNALGVFTELEYQENSDRVVSVKIDGQTKVKMVYNKSGDIIALKDALDQETSIDYVKGNLPEVITQADGSQIYLTYDEKANIIKVKDASGVETEYQYDELNRVVASIDGNKKVTSYEYDVDNNITLVTNAEGDSQAFEYDKNNKVTKITDFNDAVIKREYNELGRLSKVIDPLERVTTLGYNEMWKVSEVVQPNGAKTEFRYNQMNHLECVVKPDGSKVYYDWDANGNQISVADELRNITKFEYDALGQMIKVIDPEGNVVTHEYNHEGQVISVTDAMGNVVKVGYDKLGRLAKENNALGDSRTYTYTNLGKIETVTDEVDRVTKYDYELGGLLKSITYPDGLIENFTYDSNGNIKSHTNKVGQMTKYHYDSLNRVISMEASGRTKDYEYDPVGSVTRITDELGNQTQYEYSLTGQLTKVTDALGNETHYTYDILDQLIEVRQLGGIDGIDIDFMQVNEHNEVNRITIYKRNLLGQVESVTDALGNKETYSYSKKGELISKLDKDGYLTKYGYTKHGDVNQIQYADGKEVKLSYNPLRQLAEIQDWLGITRLELDPLGRATKVTNYNDEIVEYTYGKTGERTSLTYPDGKQVLYEYDDVLRLTKVNDGMQEINYHYDQLSRLISKQFAGGLKTEYDFNALGQLNQLTHLNGNNILDSYKYSYDAIGNKTQIDKQRNSMEIDSGLFSYGYDSLNRLKDVAKDENPLRSYCYDGFGNRISMVENDREITYTYNSLNQLISSTDGKSYSYDKRGNLVQVSDHGNVLNSYAFGALNRLEKSFNFEQSLGATYIYNGLGHRVGKSEGTALEPTLPTTKLDQIQLSSTKQIEDTLDFTRQYNNLLQRSESGNTSSYIWDDGILLSYGANEQHNYLLDDLGSPVRLLDGAGLELDVFGHNEFGVPINRVNTVNQPFGFTAYQFDGTSETMYAQARQYSPQMGRFVSQDTHWQPNNMIFGDTLQFLTSTTFIPDPLAMAQANNLYVYTVNNPLRYIDPTGWSCEEMELDELEENANWWDWLQDFIREPATIYGISESAFSSSVIGGFGAWRRSITSRIIPFGTPLNNPNPRHFPGDNYRRFLNNNTAREIGRASRLQNNVSRILRPLPYIAVAIDVGRGISHNLDNNTPERILPDAIVDTAVTGGTIWAAGKAGAWAGFKVGTVKPGLGNIVGAGVGFVVGVGSYFLLDSFQIGGNTVRGHLRNGINRLFGNG